MSRFLVWVLPFLLAFGASGCGSSKSSDDGGGEVVSCANDKAAQPFTVGMHDKAPSGVTVAIEADPPVPSPLDQSTWTLTVTDAAGAPVPSGTKVAIICKMVHPAGSFHGCTSTISVTETSEGVYEAKPVVFNMQGHWVVTFRVGDADDVAFQLCVE